MKQTLLTIPHEFCHVPTFGFGWALLFWTLFSISLILWLAKRQGWTKDTLSQLPVLAIVAAFIWFVLPRIELVADNGSSLGLPIRGYGVMLLLAIVAAVALGAREARRIGLNPDFVFSLALVVAIAGIAGARSFYIIQYWHQFERGTLAETLSAMINVTQGGLVVYGSLLGAVPAALWFLGKHKLPPLAVADVLTPSLLLGLAIGRIGCLLNGCCFGGPCDLPIAVEFPAESPPYIHQLATGQLYGFRLDGKSPRNLVIVAAVTPGGPAERAGLQPGARILRINGRPLNDVSDAAIILEQQKPGSTAAIGLETDRGDVFIRLDPLPTHSLAVHPTQIYSSVNAGLLCLLLWSLYPRRTRDGQIFALFLTLYPLTRFLLEIIRQDEPGRWHTGLTISQLISMAVLVLGGMLWIYIFRRPPKLAYPVCKQAAPTCPES